MPRKVEIARVATQQRADPSGGRLQASGFTLIEVVVVILILSIILGLAGMRLTHDESDGLREEARRLAVVLQNARQQAILEGRPIGFELTPEGYAFSIPPRVTKTKHTKAAPVDKENVERKKKGLWPIIKKDDVLGPRKLPPPMTIAFEDSVKKDQKDSNRIVFSMSGDLPDFTLVLSVGDLKWHVHGSGNGDIEAAASSDRST